SLWDVESGKALLAIAESTHSVAFVGDGKAFVSRTGTELRFHETATGKVTRRFAVNRRAGAADVFTPGGKALISAGPGEVIHFWDVATGKELRQVSAPGSRTRSLALSADGKVLVSGGDVRARLWRVATGKEFFPIEGHQGPISAVAYSPDGKTIASA